MSSEENNAIACAAIGDSGNVKLNTNLEICISNTSTAVTNGKSYLLKYDDSNYYKKFVVSADGNLVAEVAIGILSHFFYIFIFKIVLYN